MAPFTHKVPFLLFSNKITTVSNSARSLVQVVRTSNKLVLGICDPFQKLGLLTLKMIPFEVLTLHLITTGSPGWMHLEPEIVISGPFHYS
jgi:hypothetical protein